MADEKTTTAVRIYPKEIMNNVVPSDKAYAVKGITPPTMGEDDCKLVYSYLRWLTLRRARDFGIVKLQSKVSDFDKGKKSKGGSPAERLEAIKPGLSKATDWEFSGVVDLGSRNTAVKCIMGDTIRYAYYAYSPSFDVEIAFGRNCGSKFFNLALDKSADFIRQVEAAVAQGREELRSTFLEGRYPTWLPFSRAVCILKCAQRDPELSLALYKQCGRSVVELALNFLAQGWCLPPKLEAAISTGYYTVAMNHYRPVAEDTDAYELMKTVRGIDNSINVQRELRHKDAANILTQNQITYPLNVSDTLVSLKAIVMEGLYAPTPTAVRFDLQNVLYKLNALKPIIEQVRSIPENKYDICRTEVLMAGWRGNDHSGKKKQVLLPFSNATELFAFALITGDFYYLTLYLGLNPRYEVTYKTQSAAKTAFVREQLNVKTTQDIIEEKEEVSAEREELAKRFQEATGAGASKKSGTTDADKVIYRYVVRDMYNFDSVWTQKGNAAKANTIPYEWQYDVNARAYVQAFVVQHIDEITEELKRYLTDKKGAPTAYSEAAKKVARMYCTGFADIELTAKPHEANEVYLYTDCPLYVDDSDAADDDYDEDEEE